MTKPHCVACASTLPRLLTDSESRVGSRARGSRSRWFSVAPPVAATRVRTPPHRCATHTRHARDARTDSHVAALRAPPRQREHAHERRRAMVPSLPRSASPENSRAEGGVAMGTEWARRRTRVRAQRCSCGGVKGCRPRCVECSSLSCCRSQLAPGASSPPHGAHTRSGRTTSPDAPAADAIPALAVNAAAVAPMLLPPTESCDRAAVTAGSARRALESW